jgi:hypothetical protein
MQLAKQRHAAAASMQMTFRNYQLRKEAQILVGRRIVIRRELAATNIEALARGFAVRHAIYVAQIIIGEREETAKQLRLERECAKNELFWMLRDRLLRRQALINEEKNAAMKLENRFRLVNCLLLGHPDKHICIYCRPP